MDNREWGDGARDRRDPRERTPRDEPWPPPDGYGGGGYGGTSGSGGTVYRGGRHAANDDEVDPAGREPLRGAESDYGAGRPSDTDGSGRAVWRPRIVPGAADEDPTTTTSGGGGRRRLDGRRSSGAGWRTADGGYRTPDGRWKAPYELTAGPNGGAEAVEPRSGVGRISDTGSWPREPDRTGDTGSWAREPDRMTDTGSWPREPDRTSDTGSWRREPDRMTDTGSWRRDGRDGPDNRGAPADERRTDTGSWRRETGRNGDTGSWQRDSGSWQRDGRDDREAPAEERRTDTGSWRRTGREGRDYPGAPADERRTDTGSWQRETGRISDTGSWQRDTGPIGDTGSWQRDTGRISDTGSWRRAGRDDRNGDDPRPDEAGWQRGSGGWQRGSGGWQRGSGAQREIESSYPSSSAGETTQIPRQRPMAPGYGPARGIGQVPSEEILPPRQVSGPITGPISGPVSGPVSAPQFGGPRRSRRAATPAPDESPELYAYDPLTLGGGSSPAMRYDQASGTFTYDPPVSGPATDTRAISGPTMPGRAVGGAPMPVPASDQPTEVWAPPAGIRRALPAAPADGFRTVPPPDDGFQAVPEIRSAPPRYGGRASAAERPRYPLPANYDSGYRARARVRPDIAPGRRSAGVVATAGEDTNENAPGYLHTALVTTAWYTIPLLVYTMFVLTLDGTANAGTNSPRAQALTGLLDGMPRLGSALVLSLVVAMLIRFFTRGWRAVTIGFAAAVVGGGAATVLLTALQS